MRGVAVRTCHGTAADEHEAPSPLSGERLRVQDGGASHYWVSGYPALVDQWHPTRNGVLLPQHVRFGSNRSVWWVCPEGPDHEWRALASNRVRGAGCPFCARKRVSVTNSLATLYPDVASTWHASKNGALQPGSIMAFSGKKVWWKCSVRDDHAWRASVVSRTRLGHACLVCSGQCVTDANCLATIAPVIAAEWHPTRNGQLTASNVTRGSRALVWWRCRNNPEHAWEACVSARTGRRPAGCPFCSGRRVSPSNSLAARYPIVAHDWHPTRNDRTAAEVVARSGKLAWWLCGVGHEWRASPHNRTRVGRETCPAGRRRDALRGHESTPSPGTPWRPSRPESTAPKR